MGLKEALQKIGGSREHPQTPFEQACGAMEEAGGRKLILRVAKELKKDGDPSVIVEEEKPGEDSSTNKLTLRYDMQRNEQLPNTVWESRVVSIVARDTGYIFVELSFFPNSEPVALRDVANMVVHGGRIISRRYTSPIKLEGMPLEKQVEHAIGATTHIPDFRYGEGKKSLKQKPVKSKFSKRIF